MSSWPRAQNVPKTKGERVKLVEIIEAGKEGFKGCDPLHVYDGVRTTRRSDQTSRPCHRGYIDREHSATDIKTDPSRLLQRTFSFCSLNECAEVYKNCCHTEAFAQPNVMVAIGQKRI
jgi:hypothetical protein